MFDRSSLTSQLRGDYLTVLEPLFSQLNLLGGMLPMHAGLLQSVVLLRFPRMQLHSLGLVASHGPCVEVRASFSGSFSDVQPCGFPTSNSIAYGWHQAPSHAKLFNQAPQMVLNDFKCSIFPKGFFPPFLVLVNPFPTTTVLPLLIKTFHLRGFLILPRCISSAIPLPPSYTFQDG